MTADFDLARLLNDKELADLHPDLFLLAIL
jgi:hypothetical protein